MVIFESYSGNIYIIKKHTDFELDLYAIRNSDIDDSILTGSYFWVIRVVHKAYIFSYLIIDKSRLEPKFPMPGSRLVVPLGSLILKIFYRNVSSAFHPLEVANRCIVDLVVNQRFCLTRDFVYINIAIGM